MTVCGLHGDIGELISIWVGTAVTYQKCFTDMTTLLLVQSAQSSTTCLSVLLPRMVNLQCRYGCCVVGIFIQLSIALTQRFQALCAHVQLFTCCIRLKEQKIWKENLTFFFKSPAYHTRDDQTGKLPAHRTRASFMNFHLFIIVQAKILVCMTHG